ncbi:hypothetical protein [Salisediminibacterium halotolerans]|uniref:Uncharacterized protein n=1 Tax=Salisediminibacterium halotolerans TaxID=517425 RepID=A0A1H9V6J5_9BACI|nr:hypothetical protein [Salisediminibacterium haloalkalitolerans]SES17161.1 hypothetical protein SAMN05444126_11821 [Salisediminibacterium haloalkalitolerans]
MKVPFHFDRRLGIQIPALSASWDTYPRDIQEEVLYQWEHSRGHIPERIREIEEEINEKQQRLYEETDFDRSCRLNEQISERASVITDLWIWYRTGENIQVKQRTKN